MSYKQHYKAIVMENKRQQAERLRQERERENYLSRSAFYPHPNPRAPDMNVPYGFQTPNPRIFPTHPRVRLPGEDNADEFLPPAFEIDPTIPFGFPPSIDPARTSSYIDPLTGLPAMPNPNLRFQPRRDPNPFDDPYGRRGGGFGGGGGGFGGGGRGFGSGGFGGGGFGGGGFGGF
jgi:hypothetical protein